MPSIPCPSGCCRTPRCSAAVSAVSSSRRSSASEGLELDQATIAQLSRFLEADGTLRYRFRNGLVCDVVYDSLAYHTPARLHWQAGVGVRDVGTGRRRRGGDASLHFSHSDDHARAYRYATLRRATSRPGVRPSEAVVHYERAIEAARRSRRRERRRLRRACSLRWVMPENTPACSYAALYAYRRAGAPLTMTILPERRSISGERAVRERAGAFPAGARRKRPRGRRFAWRVAGDGPRSEALQAHLLALRGVRAVATSPTASGARRTALAAIELAERSGETEGLSRPRLPHHLPRRVEHGQLRDPPSKEWAQRAFERTRSGRRSRRPGRSWP